MSTPRSDPAGFVDSLLAMGDGLLASLRDRIELFSLELEEERSRLVQAFIWISAAMVAGVMALVFASLTLVYLFWDSARLAVLGGLTAVYSAGLVAVVLLVRRQLARQPRPFAATMEELDADRAGLREER